MHQRQLNRMLFAKPGRLLIPATITIALALILPGWDRTLFNDGITLLSEPWRLLQLMIILCFMLYRTLLIPRFEQGDRVRQLLWAHHLVAVMCVSVALLGIFRQESLMYVTGLSVFVVEMMVWQLMLMSRLSETAAIPAKAFLSSRAGKALISGNCACIVMLSVLYLWGLSTHGFSAGFSLWQPDRTIDVVALVSAAISILNLKALHCLTQLARQQAYDLD